MNQQLKEIKYMRATYYSKPNKHPTILSPEKDIKQDLHTN
jgi:hypothetical protein